MNKTLLVMALSISVGAQATPTRPKSAGDGSTAISCTGQTMSLSREGQTYEDFQATFILNDTAKTWMRYRADTGGTQPKCVQPDCLLNYGPQRILAKTTDGIRTELIDRAAGTYEGLVRYGTGAWLHVVNTKATCVSVPMPSVSAAGRKF